MWFSASSSGGMLRKRMVLVSARDTNVLRTVLCTWKQWIEPSFFLVWMESVNGYSVNEKFSRYIFTFYRFFSLFNKWNIMCKVYKYQPFSFWVALTFLTVWMWKGVFFIYNIDCQFAPRSSLIGLVKYIVSFFMMYQCH